MPLRPIIDMQLFGLVHIADLYWVIIFVHLYQKGIITAAFKRLKEKNLLQPLIIFTIVVFVAFNLLSIRSAILLQDYYGVNISLMWIFFRLIHMAIYIMNFIAILVVVFEYRPYRKLIYNAMTSSALLIVFSMFFSTFLDSIGLNVREPSLGFHDIPRVSGLLAYGDVNSAGIFLSIVIILVIINRLIAGKTISFSSGTLIFFLSIGIMYTGSRMGLGILVFIGLYFIFIQNIFKVKITYSLFNIFIVTVITLTVVLIVDQYEGLGLVFDRIQAQGFIEEITFGGRRQGVWMEYIYFIMSDTQRIFLGSNDIHYTLRFGSYVYVDPHNLFLTLFYTNGIVVLLFFIWSFAKLCLSFMKMRLLIYFLPLTIAVLISMMTISQYVFRDYYLLSLGFIYYGYYSKCNLEYDNFANQKLLEEKTNAC